MKNTLRLTTQYALFDCAREPLDQGFGNIPFDLTNPLAPLPHQIRTQACESINDIITSYWEKTSGYNAASDSAKGSYIGVQKISLEAEQIASDFGTLTYGWA